MNQTELLERLPHGSGFNGDWHIKQGHGTIKASNYYQCMTETGFYDGSADFSVTIPDHAPIDFKLHFHGSVSQYLNRKYMLRDYIEDTIADALRRPEIQAITPTCTHPDPCPRKTDAGTCDPYYRRAGHTCPISADN